VGGVVASDPLSVAFDHGSHGKSSTTMKLLEKSLEESRWHDTSLRLRDGETYQHRDRIDDLLKKHWNGKSAWLRDEAEEDKKQFTYGEVTPIGVRQLIHFLGLQTIDVHDEGNQMDPVVFYDLGSGAGKLVVQMFLEKVASVSIGIELSKRRHDLAVKSWNAVQEALCLFRADVICKILRDDQVVEQERVQLWNRDIMDTDFSTATHIYISSLCFPKVLAGHASQLIMETYQKYRKLKVVASLSDLEPFETDEMRFLWKKTHELLHMTWGFSTVRVYKCEYVDGEGEER
jgi:Histone methylation protein DOT1